MNGLQDCRFYFQILVVFYMKISLLAAQAQDHPEPDSFWPSGTIATGSTTHPPMAQDFKSSYAIDGRTDTLWKDNTSNIFPDVLTINVSHPIILDGIMLLSSENGWPKSYTVETNNGSDWIVRADVTGYNNALRLIVFSGSFNVSQLRINVTSTVNSGYTRINEVYPLIGSSDSDTTVFNVSTSSKLVFPSSTTWPSSSSTTRPSSSSTTRPSSSADPPTPSKKPNVGTIAGGVCGGVVVAIIIVALIFGRLWSRKQKKKNLRSNNPPTPSHSQYEAPTELMDHPVELESRSSGRPLDAKYERPELATSGL